MFGVEIKVKMHKTWLREGLIRLSLTDSQELQKTTHADTKTNFTEYFGGIRIYALVVQNMFQMKSEDKEHRFH